MKKRLFITSALMTAVMAASLATGTFAWYTTTKAGGISVEKISSGIKTNNAATLGAAKLTAEFSTLNPVELTNSSGQTYVYNGDNKTLASNQGELTKNETGTVTITNVDISTDVMKGYAGVYNVFVTSSDRVRVSNTLADNAVYNDAAIGTQVDIGDLTIDSEGNIVTTGNANVFTFYYSVKALDEKENWSAEATFGTISVSIAPQAA